jgi:hypothetical protein
MGEYVYKINPLTGYYKRYPKPAINKESDPRADPFWQDMNVGKLKKYYSGSRLSQARLKELGFDPIERLTVTYERLQNELTYWEALRSGKLVALDPKTGREIRYNAEVHASIYDRVIKIEESLLRYGYSRVPETPEEGSDRPAGMIINLNDTEEQFRIGLIEDMPDKVLPDDSEEEYSDGN